MQTITTESPPFEDVLLRDEELTVTSARIELGKTSYAIKYLSQVTLDATHPPRREAGAVLIICGIALLALVVYLIAGRVNGYAFLWLGLITLIATTVAASILWLNPSRYTLNITMINGEHVHINSSSERQIHDAHRAITTAIALNRQDPMTNGELLYAHNDAFGTDVNQ